MAKDHRRVDVESVQEVLLDDPSFLREIVERVVQQFLEAEMTHHIGAAPYERTVRRTGQRNGYKRRTLRTRVGTLNLLVPQDREGTFSTRLFCRYQRNEKALVLALMEMYVEGVSTRKVKEVTEELCGISLCACGWRLATYTIRRRNGVIRHFYVCSRRRHDNRECEHARYHRAQELEGRVRHFVRGLVKEPTVVQEQIKQHAEKERKRLREPGGQIMALLDQQERLKERRERYLEQHAEGLRCCRNEASPRARSA